MPGRTRSLVLLAALASLASLGGCAAPALTLPLVTSGVQASEVGVSLVGRGQVGRFELAPLGPTLVATRRAMNRLALTLEDVAIEEDLVIFAVRDDTGATFDVQVQARTAAVTYVIVDVGVWGEVALGSLVSMEIASELGRLRASRR